MGYMKIQIESSTACNARCVFCPRYDMTRPGGEMSDDLFYKIIKESKEFRKPEIVPFLNGEPFVFSRIWDWLDHLEREKCRVYIFTNGELMDADRLAKYSCIRYVCVSINATTAETHKKIMRGPDFETVNRNTERLVEKAKFPVYVSIVKVSGNIHEFEDFKKRWGKRVTHGEFKNWGGARHDALERTGIRIPCISLLRCMTILWDGRAVICCLDYNGDLVVGDANKQTLAELLVEYKKLWRKHYALDFNYKPCRGCNQNI